jgi:DNA-binding NarL/FixJ family response regulator
MAIQPLSSYEEMPVRALLVDDHALFRVGLRRLLNALGISVVGEASNGRDGVRLAQELRPDVVVMDLDMPVMDGIEATRLITEDADAPAVLILASGESTDVFDALLAGATSFLFKHADAAELAQGIKRAAVGESALDPSVAVSLVARLRELESANRVVNARSVPAALTLREREVLRLVAEGRDNGAIGKELYISASTVKNHVAAILGKLGATNRAQAAAEAVRIGLA